MNYIWLILEPAGYGNDTVKPPRMAFASEEEARQALRLVEQTASLKGYTREWKVVVVPVEKIGVAKAA